jgi:D-xylose transport system permease protein
VSLTGDVGRARRGSARAAGALALAGFEPRLVAMVIAGLGVGAVFHQASDGAFFTARNLYNLAVQASAVGIMACGMVLVLVTRHVDLSVGSVLGFTGMTIAVMHSEWLPDSELWPVALTAGVAAGAAVGAIQAWWVAWRGLPAFVVTLAGLMIFRGVTYLLTDGRTVAPLASGFERLGGGLNGSIGPVASWCIGTLAVVAVAGLAWRRRRARIRHGVDVAPLWAEAIRVAVVGAGVVGFVVLVNAHTVPGTGTGRGIPFPVLVLVVVAAGVHVLARRTRFGRHVYAIGGSPAAAARAGIDVRRVTLGVFVLMGVLAAIAGALTAARLGAGTSSMGTLAELAVIAAAVIGGTSLAGGVGSVIGAVFGALLMQSLENGMVLLGVSSAVRQVAIGVVLVLAVQLDVWAAATRGRR